MIAEGRIFHKVEKIRDAIAERVTVEALQGVNVEVIQEQIINSFTFLLRGFVYGEKIKHTMCKYPKNWIEAFKERWFPLWLKKKYPVDYKIIEMHCNVVYPTYKPIDPNLPFIIHPEYPTGETWASGEGKKSPYFELKAYKSGLKELIREIESHEIWTSNHIVELFKRGIDRMEE